MSAPPYDVVIAGAGPAGSTSALRLARAGFRVAIVEPRRFPRFKACGEFLSPECAPILAELGLEREVERLGARAIAGMRIVRDGVVVRGAYRDVGRARAPRDHGRALRRELFDDALLRAAVAGGVELRAGWRADAPLRARDGAVVGLRARDPSGERREIRARWTIGADGLRSRVAEGLGVRERVPWLDRIALTTRYAGVPWGADAEVHLFDGGFVGCAPLEDGALNVGVVVERARFERAGLPRDAAFDAFVARLPSLAARLDGRARIDPVRGVGPLAWRTRAQTFDGAALVGDACGYVDPITGEGIWFALRGAQLLCESLEPALHARRADRGALETYRVARAREIGGRARFALGLQRALRSATVVRAAMSAIAARPGLADVLVSFAGDYVPPRELLRPSVWRRALASPA